MNKKRYFKRFYSKFLSSDFYFLKRIIDEMLKENATIEDIKDEINWFICVECIGEDIELLNERQIAKLPRQYWREGTYLLHKIGSRAEGMFGYSEYKTLLFYKGFWFSSWYTENGQERLDHLSQPSQKEWELIQQIPDKYLSEYYKNYREHWNNIFLLHEYSLESRLYSYKSFKQEIDLY